MSTTPKTELPSIAGILAPVVARYPLRQQKLLVAQAERQAAKMYRAWAAQVSGRERTGFLRCAEREEEIAVRVETLDPAADTLCRQLAAELPDLDERVRAVYAGRPLEEQWEIQRRGERAGKKTWEHFAAAETDAKVQAVLRTCAALEDESAAFLATALDARRADKDASA